VPSVRFSRDKRGYEHTYLVHESGGGRNRPARMRVLYWFRTPPGIKVGREPFDQEARKQIEAKNPGIVFDWNAIASTPMPPVPEVEHWRERRRVERAAKVARREEEQEPARAEPESQGSATLSVSEPLVFAEATGLAEAGALADAALSVKPGPLTEIGDPANGMMAGESAGISVPDAAPVGDAAARKRRRRRGGRRRRTGADPAAGPETGLPGSELHESEPDEAIESAGGDLSEPDGARAPGSSPAPVQAAMAPPIPAPVQTPVPAPVQTGTVEQESPSNLPAGEPADTSKE
jgi:hypothetical protein